MTAAQTPARPAPTVARDDAAMIRDRREVGAYHVLCVYAPRLVGGAAPGQFLSVGVESPGLLLRRPFAIAGVDRDAGCMDLVIAAVGRGSRWLTRRPPGSRLDVVGPLGRAFRPPDAATRCVLIGGGYGVAALEWLGQQLIERGHLVELLSGASTAAALYPLGGMTDAVRVIETTEDGSRGRVGLVTAALGERLSAAGDTAVFACGPMPMLAAVAAIAAEHGSACQVAVEEHMGCSVGVCMTCVIPTSDGYVRACIDGPVLDAGTVDWVAVGRRRG